MIEKEVKYVNQIKVVPEKAREITEFQNGGKPEAEGPRRASKFFDK
jgi:hypothetical protein